MSNIKYVNTFADFELSQPGNWIHDFAVWVSERGKPRQALRRSIKLLGNSLLASGEGCFDRPGRTRFHFHVGTISRGWAKTIKNVLLKATLADHIPSGLLVLPKAPRAPGQETEAPFASLIPQRCTLVSQRSPFQSQAHFLEPLFPVLSRGKRM